MASLHCPLRFESLEDRRLLSMTVVALGDSHDGVGGGSGIAAPELTIQQINFVDPFGATIDPPVVGQQIWLRADWSFENLQDGDDYVVQFDVDGVTLDSAVIEGVEGNFSYSWWLGGWFATEGEHTVTVTVDADNAVPEANEANNTISFQFTPAAPDLSGPFAWPLAGEQNVDWIFDGSVDLDPTFEFIDYAGETASTRDGHAGVDIGITNFAAMDAGVPVLAAAAGTVTLVDDGHFDRQIEPPFDPFPDTNIVVIDHSNGWKTEYYHLRRDSVIVREGDVVAAGQQIGLVGSSGYSFRPHVHWNILHHDLPVDPFLSPDDYLEDEPLHTFDAPKLPLAFGVTNHPGPPHQHFVEQVSSIDAFPVPGSERISMVAWATIASLETEDNWEVEFFRPDGSQLIDFGPEPIGFDGGWQSLVWFTFLPEAAPVGTWRADLRINDAVVGSTFFDVGPAEPEIRIIREDAIVIFGQPADELIIDGRTTPIDFGTIDADDPSPEQTFVIENHGYADLEISGVDLPAGYTMLVAPPGMISAGATAEFTVCLDTTTPGLKRGQIVVHSNDASEPTTSFAVEGHVLNPLPGDYNLNGIVDAADYTVWRDSLGKIGVPALSGADGNGDRRITTADHQFWVDHFGETLPAVVVGGSSGGGVTTTADALLDSIADEQSSAAQLVTTLDPLLEAAMREDSHDPVGTPAVDLGFFGPNTVRSTNRPAVASTGPAVHGVSALNNEMALLAWLAERPPDQSVASLDSSPEETDLPPAESDLVEFAFAEFGNEFLPEFS